MSHVRNSLRGRAGWAVKIQDPKLAFRPLIILRNDDENAQICWGTKNVWRPNPTIIELCRARLVGPWRVGNRSLFEQKTAFYPEFAGISISQIEVGGLVNAQIFAEIENKMVGLMSISPTGHIPDDPPEPPDS